MCPTGTGIRHAQKEWLAVVIFEIFVLELFTVD